jgi:hypothetical protein
MLRIAFFCPRVGGVVGVRDCAYCRRYQEGERVFSGVIECRQENLQAVYECSSCQAALPLGALLGPAGQPICPHCVMRLAATAPAKAVA